MKRRAHISVKQFVLLSSLALVLAACGQQDVTRPPNDTLAPLAFGSSSNDYANGVASYANVYAYVVGTTSGALDGTNAGSSDIVVRKYATASATALWRRQFGSSVGDGAVDVAVDGSGNAYVLGRTAGAIPGCSPTCTNAGGQDVVLRKYNANGGVVWTRQFGTSGTETAWGVAVDPTNGYVYVAGSTTGALSGFRIGGSDAFIRKYSPSGSVAWTRQFGTSANDWANGVSVSRSGYVHVSGSTRGSLPGGRTLVGSYDAFVRQYTSAGSVRWTRQFGFGNEFYDEARDVRIDSLNNVYIYGSHYATDGSLDIFLSKYNSSGGAIWSRTAGPTIAGASWYSVANKLSVDNYGNAYLTGFTNSTFNGPLAGGIDVFVHKYNNSGTLTWAKQFGTSQTDAGNDIDVTTTGSSIYVAGYTRGALFGTNDGGDDGFIRRLNNLGNAVWTDQ